MKEKTKDILLLALFAAVGLLITLCFYFAARQEHQKAATLFVKISSTTKTPRVVSFYKTHFKFPNKVSNRTAWDIDGQVVYEDELFALAGIKKQSDKDKVTEAYFKKGYERYQQSCNSLYGPKGAWSLGYCTLELYPQEGKS